MFSIKEQYRFSFPTDIRFGVGARQDIPITLQKNDLCRPLIVTDKGLSEHAMVQCLSESLSSHFLAPRIYSEFSGNPIESHVVLGKEAFHSHKADSIVAIGGGAALDVAKAIALMSRHDGDILQYAEGNQNQRSVTHDLPFLIAVPTTSGTGSEVGRSTVISDEKTHEKKVIFHPSLMAKLVVVDPELTLNMPPAITAATGMDALSHLLESYLAKDFHPICDAISLHGLKILNNNFVSCYQIAKTDQPPAEKSLVSRGYMMLSAMMGAIAFQKGLGVTHSCAHALSTVCNTHHGLANGIMLPFAMSFNAKAKPEKFIEISKALDLKNLGGPSVISWLTQLQAEVEIPSHLSQIGVVKSQLERLVEVAVKDSCHQNNPVPVSKASFYEIFEAAIL